MATIVPAPAGSGNIAQNFQLAASQLGGGIGQFLAQRRQQELQKQDLAKLALFQRQQQAFGNQAFGGAPITQPTLQSRRGQELSLQRAFQQPRPIPQLKTSFQQIPDPQTGETINALINTQTGTIIKKFGATEDLTPKDKTQIALTQSKEFRADPRVKDLQIIERSERGMQAALKQSTSANVKSRIASDQALGVLFQKMLDPASVVRESEFARTPEGAAAMNRLLAIAPQLRLGGLRLLDQDRRALVDMAQKLLNEAKISANRAFDEFGVRADTIGLNKKIVFGGAKRFDITQESQAQGPLSTNEDILAEDRRIAELEEKARQ